VAVSSAASALAPAGRQRVPAARYGVGQYLLRRVLQALVVFILVISIVFGLSHMAANPVDILLPPGASPAQHAAETRLLGLNEPLIVQYGIFLRNAVTGNFGDSLLFHVPILRLVLVRSLATLRLAVAAIAIAAVLGVPAGVLLAVRAGTWLDRLAGVVIGLAQGIASFWLAVVLVFVFAVRLRMFPVLGDQGVSSIVLPACSLALVPLVALIRLTRSAVAAALASDFVKSARSRGVSPTTVVVRHALRNSVIPVITYAGVIFGQLISGAVITETIFNWPGIGALSIFAIQNGDYGVVEVVTMFSAAVIIALNLLVDMSYLLLDPRVRDAVSSVRASSGGERR
jgi:peptide/nickel transport system permease protein